MINILIISKHIMFGHGLESLLHQNGRCRVVGQETDIYQALEKIKTLQPDVVLVDDEAPTPNLVPILQINPDAKIITLNLQNNILHLDQTERWVTSGVQDLIETIESALCPTPSRQLPQTSQIDHPRRFAAPSKHRSPRYVDQMNLGSKS